MVRQSEDTRRVQLALVVSTARAEYAKERDFELAVAAYASMALAEVASSGNVAVTAGGATARTRHRAQVLDHSAGLTLSSEASPGVTLASAAALARRDVPGATLAVLIGGTGLSTHSVQRVARFLPREASAIAVRCRVGADLGLTRVGRIAIATVGSLEDLGRALRRLGLT
jgi:hypothetical protein